MFGGSERKARAFERLQREARGADLSELDRTGCVTVGYDIDERPVLLFMPRLGLEGTKIDPASDSEKMRKMLLLLLLQTVERVREGSPFALVYAHCKLSMFRTYTLIHDFHRCLPRAYRKNLRKVFILYASTSLRTALDVLPYFFVLRPRFVRKIVFLDEIAGLQRLIPATNLPIPPKFMHWEDVARGLNTRRGTLPSLPAIFDPSLGAPDLLSRCVQYLRSYALRKEGLFRAAGDQMACNLAQTRWQHGNGRTASNVPTIIIGTNDPAYVRTAPRCAGEMSQLVLTDMDTIAQVMKMTLSDLAEPVITFDAFERILMASAAVEAGGSERAWVETVSDALDRMPYEHQATLTLLLDFLAEVAQHSDRNLMNVCNLAIVFAPTLMRSRDEFSGKIPLQIVAEARLTHKALERIILDETLRREQREQDDFDREIMADLVPV